MFKTIIKTQVKRKKSVNGFAFLYCIFTVDIKKVILIMTFLFDYLTFYLISLQFFLIKYVKVTKSSIQFKF